VWPPARLGEELRGAGVADLLFSKADPPAATARTLAAAIRAGRPGAALADGA